jgi:twitching motility protein PilT
VLSTLPTADATETVNRIISMFPTQQQPQARLTLACVLRGVISQRLLRRADGKGMIPALEILVNTEPIRELIEDPHRTRELRAAIAEGLHPHGMMTFDQSLANLVKQRLVTHDEAIAHGNGPSRGSQIPLRGVAGTPHPGWANGPAAADVNPGAGHDEIESEHEGK